MGRYLVALMVNSLAREGASRYVHVAGGRRSHMHGAAADSAKSSGNTIVDNEGPDSLVVFRRELHFVQVDDLSCTSCQIMSGRSRSTHKQVLQNTLSPRLARGVHFTVSLV
jgi:hypothetical protein